MDTKTNTAMRAEELRIGNWVYMGSDYGDEQVTAYQIYNFNMTRNQTADYYREWQPIPLTEEWLKRFGFKVINALHDGTSVFQRADSKTLYLHNSGCWISGASHVSCKYVHQLQNLYFALTGEEL